MHSHNTLQDSETYKNQLHTVQSTNTGRIQATDHILKVKRSGRLFIGTIPLVLKFSMPTETEYFL